MGEKFALIVGIENYHDTHINPVTYAESDAREFAEALKLHGYDQKDIKLLVSSGATKTVIQSYLRNLLSTAAEDDEVIIFYAGHGFAENDNNYLTASDTVKGDLVRTSISLQRIFEFIRKSKCKKVLLFLDSCHSGFDIDESMRGILSDMTDEEFKEFFEDSKYHLAFSSCDTEQYSYSSKRLRHGIWTYHIIEAFKGNETKALDRDRFLTAESLQAYLSKEVPRSVRKLLTGTQVQTPRVLGNYSKGFILADFKEIFEQRAANLQPKLNQLKKVLFSGAKFGNVKSLSGFRKYSHKVPDSVNSATERFVARIGQEDVQKYADEVFQNLKDAFHFKRADINLQIGDATATILTPNFTVEISLGIDPDDPSGYVLTTEVTDIIKPSAIQTEEFNNVFEDTFNCLKFQFEKKTDITALIDAVEAIEDPELISIDYPADTSFCTIKIEGLDAEIKVTQSEFIISHGRPVEPIRLINSFNNAQKLLVNTHSIKLLPLR